MNKAEIANIFIKAAAVDSRLPINARPKRLKGTWVGHAPLTEDDMRKWFIREPTDKGKSKLHKNDDPVKDWWLQFWDGDNTDASRKDYRVWELANALVKLVADEGNRRALWAWAMSKAGTLNADDYVVRQTKKFGKLKVYKRTGRDVSFKAWCQSEGIHDMTGSRRKDRAIAVIEQYLVRGGSQNAQTGEFGVLPVGPVFEHISDNIRADAPEHIGPTFERDRDTVFAKEDTLSVWREYRNARRREREARKRQEAA